MARAALTAASRVARLDAGAADGLLGGSLPKAATVLSVRVLLLCTGLATGILLPLCLSRDDVALFFLAQSIIAIAAAVAQLGLPQSASVLLPSFLAVGDTGRARILLWRGLCLVAAAGTAVGATLWLATAVSARFLADAGFVAALAAAGALIAASVPLAALQMLVTEYCRGLGDVLRASLLATGASVPVAVALIGAWVAGLRLDFAAVLACGVVGSLLLTGAAGIGLLQRSRPWRAGAPGAIRPGTLLVHAWPNLFAGLLLLILAQADLWLVAQRGDAGTLANYGLATRMAMLVVLPLVIANTVAGPMIAVLWARRKPRVLQRLMFRIAVAAGAGALVGYVAALALGRIVIDLLWGPDYAQTLLLFAILGFGQLCHAAGGSAGVALLALGRQRDVMRITAATGGGTVVLGAGAAAWLGAPGVAAAFSAGLAVQTWLFVRTLRDAHGLDPTACHAVALRRRRAGGGAVPARS